MVYLLMILTSVYPLMFIVCSVISLWNLNLKSFKEVFKGDFQTQEEPHFKGEQYYSYKTPLDYLLNRKTWHTTTTGIDLP